MSNDENALAYKKKTTFVNYNMLISLVYFCLFKNL